MPEAAVNAHGPNKGGDPNLTALVTPDGIEYAELLRTLLCDANVDPMHAGLNCDYYRSPLCAGTFDGKLIKDALQENGRPERSLS